ncbi:hypothetical protein ACJX0J_017266, partial [Zea mays]
SFLHIVWDETCFWMEFRGSLPFCHLGVILLSLSRLMLHVLVLPWGLENNIVYFLIL